VGSRRAATVKILDMDRGRVDGEEEDGKKDWGSGSPWLERCMRGENNREMNGYGVADLASWPLWKSSRARLDP
jgi:hypothetical protein